MKPGACTELERKVTIALIATCMAFASRGQTSVPPARRLMVPASLLSVSMCKCDRRMPSDERNCYSGHVQDVSFPFKRFAQGCPEQLLNCTSNELHISLIAERASNISHQYFPLPCTQAVSSQELATKLSCKGNNAQCSRQQQALC
eukprot:2351613-Pleurochrysis_carterae.AAC.1